MPVRAEVLGTYNESSVGMNWIYVILIELECNQIEEAVTDIFLIDGLSSYIQNSLFWLLGWNPEQGGTFKLCFLYLFPSEF